MSDGTRPIDRKRNAAIQLKLGAEGDGNIVKAYKFGDRMLWIMERGIHEVSLPDDIDPERTNASLPPAQQRIVSVGASDPIVQRTLLTADILFDGHALGGDFDYGSARLLALELLQNILATRNIQRDFSAAVLEQRVAYEERDHDSSIRLPSIADAKARCENFSQKTNHVLNSLASLVRLFYGQEVTLHWIDSLARLVSKKYGAQHQFTEFMARAAPVLKFMLNMRHVVEHPKANYRMIVSDFSLDKTGMASAPTIEIEHPDTPHARCDACNLMEALTESASVATEEMMAHLCAVHVGPSGPFDLFLNMVPEEGRQNGVRFAYFAEFHGKIGRFSGSY